MHHFARRTAGFAAAIAAGGLLVAGCGDDNDTSDDVGSLTSAVIPGQDTEGQDRTGEQTEETSPTGTATGTESPGQTPGAAAGETTISTPDGDITVSGEIYQKYEEAGGQTSPLGLPREAEEEGPDGGKYQDFIGGTIAWSPDSGAHIVWGDIRQAWEDNGGAAGGLGYPVSDEEDTPEGKKSEFTGGTITWNEADRQTTVTEK